MLKQLMLLVTVVFCIAGCKSDDAFNYSQDFVKKEQSLLPDITKTENLVNIYMETKQYDSIAIAGGKMEMLVNSKIKEVKENPAPNVKESDNFKEACIKYFQFIKSMYSGYKEFGMAQTDVAREEKMKELFEISNKKTAAINAIQIAQKKFADANGFKLEKIK